MSTLLRIINSRHGQGAALVASGVLLVVGVAYFAAGRFWDGLFFSAACCFSAWINWPKPERKQLAVVSVASVPGKAADCDTAGCLGDAADLAWAPLPRTEPERTREVNRRAEVISALLRKHGGGA